jgi:hypothetical protein
MKIIHVKKYVWLLLLVPLLFGACKKRKEQLIIGKWKQETYTLQESPTPTYWIFESDGTFTVYNDRASADLDTAIATYKIVMKSLVLTHMEITNPYPIRGLWRVEKLNKKILVMQRVGWLDKKEKANPYLRREFTNVN